MHACRTTLPTAAMQSGFNSAPINGRASCVWGRRATLQRSHTPKQAGGEEQGAIFLPGLTNLFTLALRDSVEMQCGIRQKRLQLTEFTHMLLLRKV